MQAANISKDTKLLTILKIEGFSVRDIVDFSACLLNPTENAVHFCNKFLKLPDYDQIIKAWDDKQKVDAVLNTPKDVVDDSRLYHSNEQPATLIVGVTKPQSKLNRLAASWFNKGAKNG